MGLRAQLSIALEQDTYILGRADQVARPLAFGVAEPAMIRRLGTERHELDLD
ncbi:hypothetical protein STXM2123_2238 [Streptomyces sp. F-3]|nr:hypothetical protein STXM2123_2238 [Streptomyces sp. F-3]